MSRTELTNLVEDQRENDRREREAQTIADLSGSEQESAVIVEAQRQANYDLLVCHVYRQSSVYIAGMTNLYRRCQLALPTMCHLPELTSKIQSFQAHRHTCAEISDARTLGAKLRHSKHSIF